MATDADIAEFADLWALMYCTMAREMVDSFGEEGKKALIRAIQSYGKVRGERLRKRHQEQGLPINMRSLFEHYDLPGHPETEKTRKVFTDNYLESYTYLCTHERIWHVGHGHIPAHQGEIRFVLHERQLQFQRTCCLKVTNGLQGRMSGYYHRIGWNGNESAVR